MDGHAKDYLTESEIAQLLAASKLGRHGMRDYCMMRLAYRHGLRVSESIDIRIADVDMVTARLFVRRLKGSLSTSQPMEGDELRAIRAWQRQRSLDINASHSPFLFLSERGPFTRQALNYLVQRVGQGRISVSGSSSYAEAFLRILLGEQRIGYAVDSGLSRTPQYRSYRALHPNCSIPI